MAHSLKSFINLIKRSFTLLNKEQKSAFTFQILFSLVLAIFEVLTVASIIPLLFKLGNDQSLNTNILPIVGESDFSILATVIVVVFLAKNFISIVLLRKQSNFVSKIAIDLSKSLFEQFYRQSWINHLQNNSTESIRKLNTTAFDFSNHVLFGLMKFLSELIVLSVITIFLVFIDYRIVILMVLAGVPFLGLYHLFRSKVIANIDNAFRVLTPQASIILSQAMSSLAETTIYKKHQYFINRFISLKDVTGRYLANLRSTSQLPALVLELIAVVCFVSLFFYASNYENTEFPLVLVGLLSLAFYKIMPQINKVLTSIINIQAYGYTVSELEVGFTALEEITKSLSEPVNFKNKISLNALSFQYTGAQRNFGIDNINLIVQKGDLIIIEGKSGSGKTTLLHILCGLITDFKGQMLVDDKVITHADIIQWHGLIGYVPQHPTIIQDTLQSNIAFGDDQFAYDRGDKVIRLVGLESFLESLPKGYSTLLGENGSNISGGQRQRIALARALYKQPEVLILDEVTSQLDVTTKHLILQSLKDLTQKGVTVILATHEPIASTYASKITRLDEGRLYIDKKKTE